MLPPLPSDAPRAPSFLLAFSGGLDSTALLHLFAHSEYRPKLRAIHVHHGLQADADAWATHCQRVCDALKVPLHTARVEVRNAGAGPEAAARHARYRAIADALADAEILVTAHHRDDQAETFLLRALRASGPDGLAAMRPWRKFARGFHWRPLLDVARAQLQDYAAQNDLAWIEDASNAAPEFDRNFLRLDVLPLLRARWPQADAAFARSAALNAEAADLLAEEDAKALAFAQRTDAHELHVHRLLELPAPRRARVLRRWIDALGLPPLPANGVARIETELLPADDDAEARFDWNDVSVRRWRDVLRAGNFPAPLPAHWQQEWDGRLPLALPAGGWLELTGANALPTTLLAHARRGGERIRLPQREHSSELKKLLQQHEVPPWTRAAMPLLAQHDGELMAAGDAIIADKLDDWLKARAARIVWNR